MSTLFWFSFFFASPPPAHACSVHGTPMLEIRERSETSTAITTKKIYNSGAWTLDGDSATAQGCFDRKELKAIRRALQQATWKVTQSPIACFAYDPHFTEYVLNGRLRYTHRMCSGKTADFETMEAIDLVQRELAEEMPPPPAPAHPAPPVKPMPPVTAMPPTDAPPPVRPEPRPIKPPVAVCRADGTPLFEIRKRSEVEQPTSTTAIYSNGAWTFQPIDKDGHLGALMTGCLDKATLQSIRKAVNDAPWDVTFSKFVCRAYSASFTQYYVHGKLEYTARLCNGQRLDDASAAALKLIEADLANVLPKQDPVVVRDHRATPVPVSPVVVRDHRAVL